MKRTDKIKARLAAATPGPWLLECCDADTGGINSIVYSAEHGDVCELYADARPASAFHRRKADATLIAAAPTDLAYLLARVERLEAALDKVVCEASQYVQCQRCTEMARVDDEDNGSAIARAALEDSDDKT